LRYATTPGSPSFTDFLAAAAPDLLPHGTPADAMPHGTTIVAAVYEGGVVMAGDRRSTAGNLTRSATSGVRCRRLSLIGIAGAAGLAVEIVRLFRSSSNTTKKSGTQLTLDGKATGSRR
jgi:proteasome beta subunit